MIRLLLDQGLPRSTVGSLSRRGVAVRHVADVGLERAPDVEILRVARDAGEVVVTLDADFHSLLAVSGARGPSVIRIRREGLRGPDIARLVEVVLERTGDMLELGAMVTVDWRSIRVHRLRVFEDPGRSGGER